MDQIWKLLGPPAGQLDAAGVYLKFKDVTINGLVTRKKWIADSNFSFVTIFDQRLLYYVRYQLEMYWLVSPEQETQILLMDWES